MGKKKARHFALKDIEELLHFKMFIQKHHIKREKSDFKRTCKRPRI